jgi:hypothetical protein
VQALLKKGIGGIKLLVTAVGPLLPAPGYSCCYQPWRLLPYLLDKAKGVLVV